MNIELHDEWPHVRETWINEGDEHVRLKNHAVLWLLEEGFRIGDIDIEKEHVPRNPGRGGNSYIDVSASKRGKRTTHIECETRFSHNLTSISTVGKRLYHGDDRLLVCTAEGLWEFRHETQEVEKNALVGNHTWTEEETVLTTRKVAELPPAP